MQNKDFLHCIQHQGGKNIALYHCVIHRHELRRTASRWNQKATDIEQHLPFKHPFCTLYRYHANFYKEFHDLLLNSDIKARMQ